MTNKTCVVYMDAFRDCSVVGLIFDTTWSSSCRGRAHNPEIDLSPVWQPVGLASVRESCDEPEHMFRNWPLQEVTIIFATIYGARL